MTVTDIDRPQVDKVLSSLKDFQRDTVEYVFRRLYEDEDSVSRFLIADEVGLGKTLVARGLIAKTVDHLWDTVDRIDVVYICSNQDIARQNIDRLNITNEHEFQHASRATLLPIVIDQLRGKKLNFISLTPGTSFNLRPSTGWAWERAVLYNLLQKAWDVPNGTLKNVLRGDVGKRRWQELLDWFDASQNIDLELQENFISALQKEPGLRDQYDQVGALIGGRRKYMTSEMRQHRNKLLGDLRRLLARSSLTALEPDLVILDEFQRFKYLLDDDNEFALLAQQLFNFPDAKVLLLSATPYKMFTLNEESGENHYVDFERTVKFLLNGRAHEFEQLQNAIAVYREALFRLGIDSNSRNQLHDSKAIIEDILCKVMERTERLAVSTDRNGMLAESIEAQNLVGFRDLVSFVYLDQISSDLNVEDQVEYWKSSSYPLNLMEGYKLKRKFESACRDKPETLFERLVKAQPYFLEWESFQEYQEVDPGNARMRALLADTVETGNWKQLWLPPALPYYLPEGAFAEQNDKGKTKSLIFSAWRIVPKVISVLLSYEVERRMIGEGKNEFNYSEFTVKRSPLLRFARSRDRLTGMSVFALIYPCLSLASEIDPLYVARGLAETTPAQFNVWKRTQWQVEKLLSQALEDKNWDASAQVDERWYWAALLLLDAHFYPEVISEWLNTDENHLSWPNMLQIDEDEENKESRFSEHVAELKGFFEDPSTLQLGRQPDDLVEVLTDIALAGPAVDMLRSLIRVTGVKVESPSNLAAAAQVGLGFRTLFNQPDAISMLQVLYPEGAYWQKALKYGVDGNLQAVLDEYTHILLESLGLKEHEDQKEVVIKIGETVRQALSIRAPSLRFDEIILDEESKKIDLEKRGIRCRYALRFGDDKADDYQGGNRDTNVRIAFNSPFRPFVLATTSVGQEGLDFHQYCHRVVHWNLPSNPVDLEQREGRVHRYKGHVIRRNLSQKYGFARIHPVEDGLTDPWKQLFQIACDHRPNDMNELMPFWIFEEGDYRIERLVPIFPLSREVGQLERLKRSLVAYRSVIGQARQEEMLEFLTNRFSQKELEALTKECTIDLSPPNKKNGN